MISERFAFKVLSLAIVPNDLNITYLNKSGHPRSHEGQFKKKAKASHVYFVIIIPLDIPIAS